MIKAVWDALIVKADEKSEKMHGKFIVPDLAQEKAIIGTVIEAGPGKWNTAGTERVPMSFKVDTEIFDIELREYREKTKSEMIAEFNQILEASDYIKSDTAVLIEGEYLSNNQNGEGVIIKAKKIINTFCL